jgi:uncharacterized membrane protein
MALVLETIEIEAPREDVFATLADIPSSPEFISGVETVEMLTEGPVGQGTRWKETRALMGKQAAETLEISAFNPPESYEVSCLSCGALYVAQFRIEALGATQTRVTNETSVKPQTMAARIMAPLGKLMSGTMKKCARQDLQDLKAHCEGSVAKPG